MTCFTYVQFFIKWFHWMIQLWSENMVFFMFKKSDTALMQASMVYHANVIGAFLYLLILNFTTFFILVTFLIHYFFYFLVPLKFWIFLVPFLYCSLVSGFDLYFIFWLSFFHLSNFQVFTLYICQLYFRIFLIFCYHINSFGCSTFQIFLFAILSYW